MDWTNSLTCHHVTFSSLKLLVKKKSFLLSTIQPLFLHVKEMSDTTTFSGCNSFFQEEPTGLLSVIWLRLNISPVSLKIHTAYEVNNIKETGKLIRSTYNFFQRNQKSNIKLWKSCTVTRHNFSFDAFDSILLLKCLVIITLYYKTKSDEKQ